MSNEFHKAEFHRGGFVPEQLELVLGEGIEVFWNNPWTKSRERIICFMWPAHPFEETTQVEQWYETMAQVMVQAYNKSQEAFTEFHKIGDEGAGVNGKATKQNVR